MRDLKLTVSVPVVALSSKELATASNPAARAPGTGYSRKIKKPSFEGFFILRRVRDLNPRSLLKGLPR